MRTAFLLLTAVITTSCAHRTDFPTSNTMAMPDDDAHVMVAVPSELVATHPALLRAWQGEDPNALRPFYADNAIIVTPTERYAGWNDMNARWITPTLQVASNFMAMPSSFVREGNDIIENGRYHFSITKDGQVHAMKGRYAHRWQRQPDGTWRVVSANLVEEEPR
jgi:ketosteroid isomerase-like protein